MTRIDRSGHRVEHRANALEQPRLLAGMNVGVRDVTDPIKALIRRWSSPR